MQDARLGMIVNEDEMKKSKTNTRRWEKKKTKLGFYHLQQEKD